MTTDKRNKTGAELTEEVLQKLTTFSEPHKAHALKMHDLILQANPSLQPRLWYGMPGYAKSKDSAVLCFFREDSYMTFGLTEQAIFANTADSESKLMPSAWFFKELNEATEQQIVQTVKRATDVV